MFNPILGKVFHFAWAELERNREGQLTGDQEQYLKWRDIKITGLCGVGIVLTTVFSLAVVSNTSGCLFLGLIAGLLAYGCLSYWPMNEPYMLSSIEGQARLRIDRGRKRRYFVFEVQGYHFYINGAQFRALDDGTRYVVYYVTREKREPYKKVARKTILSIECIVEDKNHVL
ncbi:MAG: hypothetical protein HY862_19980 [Chloroflexi bacterium]|nr:hypothetical protein [Chloroflexota bacterium]